MPSIDLHVARTAMTIEVTKSTEEKLVKHSFYDGARTNAVKQEVIARVLGVNQSSVSRMMNPEEAPAPFCCRSLLLHRDPFTRPIAEVIIESIGASFHPEAKDADGLFIDDLLSLTTANGKLAEIIEGSGRNEIQKLQKLAAQIDGFLLHLRTEIDALKRRRNEHHADAPDAGAETLRSRGGKLERSERKDTHPVGRLRECVTTGWRRKPLLPVRHRRLDEHHVYAERTGNYTITPQSAAGAKR